MSVNLKDYVRFGNALISARDLKTVQRFRGDVTVLSTVCPDYPSENGVYTFRGLLGEGISLTARLHLSRVPSLLEGLRALGLTPRWNILLADLPETVDAMQEFLLRVAENRTTYLHRCEVSVQAIAAEVGEIASVETFTSFYGSRHIPYLRHQEEVTSAILCRAETDDAFRGAFQMFAFERATLSEKFRGRHLSAEERFAAGAHAMSLYVTHGTLLRHVFRGQPLLVVNHDTSNLRHFFLSEFLPGFSQVGGVPRFPFAILPGNLYGG